MNKKTRFAQDLRTFASLPADQRSLVAEAFHRIVTFLAGDTTIPEPPKWLRGPRWRAPDPPPE